jgi:putative ABC transport system permease protein
MRFHYLKIAWRNLTKRKVNTLINVIGLSTGMAVCILLLLFINDEKSFDSFHEKKDRVFRVVLERIYPGRSTFYSFIPAIYW